MSNLSSSGRNSTVEYMELSEENANILMTYTLLIITTVVSSISSALVFFYFATRISIKLHKDTLNKMIMATMEFFDRHLTGNILNRFSKDIGFIDEALHYYYFEVIRVSCRRIEIFSGSFLFGNFFRLFIFYVP